MNFKDIVNINELNNLALKVGIEEGEIRLSNSSIKSTNGPDKAYTGNGEIQVPKILLQPTRIILMIIGMSQLLLKMVAHQ